MNTLTHYTKEPRTLNRVRRYTQLAPDTFSNKPIGLWVSVDGEDDWYDWCTREGFFVDGLKHAHRVTLADDAAILWVATRDDFISFVEVYGRTEHRSRSMVVEYAGRGFTEIAIDWPAIARDYDGVIIAPYLWGFRLSHMWYYGWDCASGCIWNLDAIADFNPIPQGTRRFRELDMKEATE